MADHVRKLGYGERHVSMDRMIPFVPVVKDAGGDLEAEIEFITDSKFPKEIVKAVVGQEIKINEIENFSILFEDVKKTKLGKQEIQIPTESIFVFQKLLTFVQRQNREKLKKDLYYVYYMLRFSPSKEHLVADVSSRIKARKEGKKVSQNLYEYFRTVDSKGPLFVEEENGPDPYIDDLRQDIFDRFNMLWQKKE